MEEDERSEKKGDKEDTMNRRDRETEKRSKEEKNRYSPTGSIEVNSRSN
jgi:hypothetical protein